MSKSISSKGYKRFYPALKWIFSVLSVYFFIVQLKQLEADFFQGIAVVFKENILLFIFTGLLAFLNWAGESLKFTLLIKSEIALTRVKALLIIFSGMAISNFTPARTGEYIGRGLMLKSTHPIKVVMATITGNITQVLMTYGIGLLSLVYLFLSKGNYTTELSSKAIYVGALFCVLLTLVLTTKHWLKPLIKWLPKSAAKSIRFIKNYNRKLFYKVVKLSFFRYFCFSTQFFLLLQLFSNFQLPLLAFALIPSAYLLQSIVPVPAITDVGVRVAVSQLLFGDLLADESILQAVTTLWFINLIVPGVLGTIYIVITNLKERW